MHNSTTSITGLSHLKDNQHDDENPPIESVDRRTVSLLRLLLALSALLITLIDAPVPDRFAGIAYGVLVGYCLYSLFLFLLASRQSFVIPVRYTHWIDLGWYALLVGLSNGGSSIFFFFFFFAVLVAAFRWGYKEGVYVTAASAIIFIIIGYATSPSGSQFELNRFLIRPLYLVVFGYMMAVWGGRELAFRRQLALLRDVNRLSNPRFGINRTLQSGISRLRAFYDADCCLLITGPDPHSRYKTWRDVGRAGSMNQITNEDEFAVQLSELAGDRTILYASNKRRLFERPLCCCLDPQTDTTTSDPAACEALARLLKAESFIVLPIYAHETLIGRLCLTSGRKMFEMSDVNFVRQLVEQVFPGIENIQLLDRLASQAAERQRQTTSRDLHDSTIQPYIGLKLGLEAVQLKAASGQPIEGDIQKLVGLADMTISDLRGIVNNLRDGEPAGPQGVLTTAVRQQAVKYKEFYGIDVEVEAPDDFHLNDRLAAEAFQIITEGLSNIRRHTTAKSVAVRMFHDADTLFVLIENINNGSPRNDGFVPKSISGRARSLGGKATTETSDTLTRVTIAIPM